MPVNLIYKEIPAVALRGLVIFPGMRLHFEVGREKSIAAFRAAVAEEADAVETVFDEFFGELRLTLVHIEIGDMNEGLRLFRDRLCDGGMAMPQTAHRDTGGEIKKFSAVTIPKPASLTSGEKNVGLRIGFHDVLVIKPDILVGQSSVHLPESFHIFIANSKPSQ